MTIKQIGNKIIKEIKDWPDEAKQSQSESSPKTSWDEYKEQIQYEEYDSFEVFQETIESMVEDEVFDLPEEDIETIYQKMYNGKYPFELDEFGLYYHAYEIK